MFLGLCFTTVIAVDYLFSQVKGIVITNPLYFTYPGTCSQTLLHLLAYAFCPKVV